MTQTIIRAKDRLDILELSELLRYHELFYIFTWRDLKVRYKQTFLGFVWVLFQPLITMIIISIFFGQVTKDFSVNLPYPLFVLIGLTFWTFFSSALTHSANCLIDNEQLIKKVYFPRIILPITATLTSFVDFIITLILFMMLIFFYHIQFSFQLFIVVLGGSLITFLAALSLGLLLSAINVKYRDVRYILPFFIQILLFVSPVIYPMNLNNQPLRYLLALNPLSGVIETVRSVAAQTPIKFDILILSIVSTFFLFLIGLVYFKRTESFFADIV